MNTVVLFTCDVWKMSDSMSLVGVYNDINALRNKLVEMLKEDRIENDQEIDIEDGELEDFQNNLTYCHLVEVEMNKEV